MEPEAISNIVDPTIIKGINEHTEYDVGFYCLYTEDDMKKVFKHGCFGLYTDQEWGCTNKFSIQIREESVALAAVMKIIMAKLESEKKNKFSWKQFAGMTPEQISS